MGKIFEDKLRFFHTVDLNADRSTWRQVYPLGKKTYEYKKNKKQIYYRHAKKGDFVFSNYIADDGPNSIDVDDFFFFNAINNDPIERCRKRFIVTEQNCGGTWSEIHTGKFTMNDGKWDLDQCKVEIKQNLNDAYSCLVENKKEKFNIIGVAPVVTAWSPVQNNFDFSGCRNKEWLSLLGKPCDATGGWKQFFTKTASNNPQPRATIYNDNTALNYKAIGQTANHAYWIKQTVLGYILEVYRFADNSFLTYNFLDAQSTGVVDTDMVAFTTNNKKNFYCYRPDTNALTTIALNHTYDIVWFDIDDQLNEGYAFFYDTNNHLYAYDFNTAILRIVDVVDIQIELQTLVPVLQVSYGDGLLAYHDNVSNELRRYDPLTFLVEVVYTPLNIKFLHSESGFLTWFDINTQEANLQYRDDTTFEIIVLQSIGFNSRYYARENEWLVIDNEFSQLAFNLINRKGFWVANSGGGSFIPTNLVYKIENGWWLTCGASVQAKVTYLDSENPSMVFNDAWNIALTTAIQEAVIKSPNLQMSAGVERIYYSGLSSTGGVPFDFEIWSIDMKDGSNTLVETLGPNTDPLNEIGLMFMNGCEQVLTVNTKRVTIYKENIQRDDELTIWFREKTVTICNGGNPTNPTGGPWILYRDQCNEFGFSTWVKQPVMAAPPIIDIKEGGCLCTDDTPDLSYDPDECINVDPNAKPSNLLMLPTTALTAPQIRGYNELKQPLGAFPTSKKWYIENPRDGSTYTWSIPSWSGATITAGQGTPIVTITMTLSFPITQLECQEVNPCEAAPIPVSTLPMIYRPWNGVLSGACTHNIPSISSIDIYSGGTAVFIGINSNVILSGESSSMITILPDGRIKTEAVHDGVSANVIFGITIAGCVGLGATVPVVASPSAEIIVTPLEVCPTGLQTYIIPTAKPNCGYTWSVTSPCFIVGSTVGTSVVVDMNGAVGIEVLTAYEVCPITSINYQLIAPCNKLHSDSWWWIVGQDVEYTRNRLLKNVVEDLVAFLCPDISVVRSDFFQWNPLNPSLFNYVYGGINQYNYLTIAQKSDIRNPTSTEGASIGEITWDQFEEWLANMEVYYVIIDGELHIEHISRFIGVVGLDLTQPPYAKMADKQNNFRYAKAEMSRREEYKWMEAENAEFVGFPIEYKDSAGEYSLCVNEDTENRDFKDLTTDLKFIQTNIGDIDNKGFVILANTFNGVDYNVIQDAGLITGVSILNNPMSISTLQERFMRFNRILAFGNMNRNYTQFDSSQFFKKQGKFKVPLCCDVDFDPISLITTKLGNGQVETAEIDYKEDTVELKIKYE
jgi:hypothetical protein